MIEELNISQFVTIWFSYHADVAQIDHIRKVANKHTGFPAQVDHSANFHSDLATKCQMMLYRVSRKDLV